MVSVVVSKMSGGFHTVLFLSLYYFLLAVAWTKLLSVHMKCRIWHPCMNARRIRGAAAPLILLPFPRKENTRFILIQTLSGASVFSHKRMTYPWQLIISMLTEVDAAKKIIEGAFGANRMVALYSGETKILVNF